MLQPARRKYRKDQKGRNFGNSHTKGVSISFGKYGLKSISRGFLTSRQIESGRRVISKYIRREGKMWIRVFPDKVITKKPLEVRMGNGKGLVEYYVAKIRPGRILYEIDGISSSLANKILKLVSLKLPLLTTVVVKNFYL